MSVLDVHKYEIVLAPAKREPDSLYCSHQVGGQPPPIVQYKRGTGYEYDEYESLVLYVLFFFGSDESNG